MKIVISVFALVTAACLGFNSAISAQTATSTQSGTVATTCAVIVTNGTLNPVANTINSGKFATLCNTSPSRIALAVGTIVLPRGQSGETIAYTLTSASSGAVYKIGLLSTYDYETNVTSDTVDYAVKDIETDLNASTKIIVESRRVLVGSSFPTAYSIPITATLTP